MEKMEKSQKVLFISSLDTTGDKLKYDGVMKKIMLEIKTLYQMSFDVDYIERTDNYLYLRNILVNSKTELMSIEKSFYSTMASLYDNLSSMVDPEEYDYIYMRFEHVSLSMTSFLGKVKKMNKRIKIIAELPTYMGKWEPGTSLIGKFVFIGKRVFSNIIPLHIDRMATFSNHDALFGIKTIKIENFVDVESIPLRMPKVSNETHLLGVAMMTPSHGFDRVINGLADYYKNKPQRKVYFHIVGKGSVVPVWKELVEYHKLNDYVIFEGVKTSEELNEYFDNSQIAVASLAAFRKKTPKHSELKIREYTARGIPFIYSALEPQFENQSFCLKVPHDESYINIRNVLDFYDKLDVSQTKYEMREFALNNCNCRGQFEKIFSDK